MLDISLFGALIGSLATGASLVLLALALGAAAYLGITGIEAARRLPQRAPGGERVARAIGIAAGVLSLVIAALGLRIGPGAGSFGATALIALAGSWAIGAGAACAWSFAGAGLVALRGARVRQLEASKHADEERQRGLLGARQSWLQGEDLRAEVVRADAAVGQLRRAVAGLQATHAALEAKVSAAEGGDAALIEEASRVRDEAGLRIDLARRVLEAAEAAAFRLACHAPLRVLLRRRPRAATDALGAGLTNEPALRGAAAAIESFLNDVRYARNLLDSLEARRPASVPAGEGDPLGRSRRDVEAMEGSYRALLERLGVARLRLEARAGAEAVEAAAGVVSGAAGGGAVDPAEISGLVGEIARAEAAVAEAAPEAGAVAGAGVGGSRGLAETLAAGSAALDRSDEASLGELIAALREIR